MPPARRRSAPQMVHILGIRATERAYIDEEAVRAVRTRRIRTNVRRNMGALEAVTADDYVQIDWVGKVLDKAATLERIKSSDMQSHALEDLNVRVYGNTAIVVGTAIRKGVTGDRDISGTFRYTRVYVNRDGRWQVVHFQQTRVAPTP